MKFLSNIFFISLFAFSLNTVSKMEFDLKSGQSVQAGSNVKVKITATVTASSGESESFKTGTFELQKSDDAAVKATLTCSLDTAVTSTVSDNGATSPEAECTVASLTTAGTYKLASVSAATKDGSATCTSPAVKANGNTLTVTAAGTDSTNSGGEEEDDGAKFLNSFYSLIALILFL